MNPLIYFSTLTNLLNKDKKLIDTTAQCTIKLVLFYINHFTKFGLWRRGGQKTTA